MQPLCSQPLFSPPHTPDGGKGRFCFPLKWLEMRITTPLCCLALLAGRSQPSLQKPSAELPRFYQCGDQSPGNIKLCLRMCSELVGKAGATPSLHLQVVRTMCILSERVYFFARVLQASKSSPAHQLRAFSRDSGFISPTRRVPCLFSCQLCFLATIPSCLFGIHPTEVSIKRNHVTLIPVN